jgi:PAS domain S-box-containing protein
MTATPRPTAVFPDRGLAGLALALTALIFAVSLAVPLEIAVGTLYLVVVLLGLRASDDRFALFAAGLATALTAVSAVIGRPDAHLGFGIINRVLSVLVIWLTALLVRRYKRAQQVAATEARMTQQYLDVAGVILLALDGAGRVRMINRQGCALLGRPENEIVGVDWIEHFIPERLRHQMRAVHDHVASTAPEFEYFENPVLTGSGEERVIAWHNTLLHDESGRVTGTLSSGTDVTESREAERRLRASRKDLEELKSALDQSAIVAITNVQGRITYVNDKFCEISRYSRDELLGQDHRIVNSGYHPKEFFRGLWQTIGNGGIWRGEIRNKAKDGSLYWVDTTIVPFLDERGHPYQYMAIRNEVTERKRAEALLREQTTLARLGEMAAVVAHEVKNPIAGIRGVLQVIGARMPAESRDRAVISDVQERLDTLNELLQDLLLFARPTEPRTTRAPIRPLVEDTVHHLKRDPGTGRLEVSVAGEDPVVSVDPAQFQRALLNLLINAGQAMNGEGRIQVAISARDGRCEIAVRDHGAGIPADVRERIFEPFFTTKHRGTGLGLPTAKRIIERHGGILRIECPEGGGTIVRMSLPLA